MSRLGEDPFAAPPALRDPARQLRGRLTLPVTLWTTETPTGERVGLTVSSVLVAEGQPAVLLGLVGPLGDFADALQASGRFLVQVLGAGDRAVADLFAGRYPSVDPFQEVGVRASPYGPVVAVAGPRAGCTLLSTSEVGWSLLVQARIDEVALGPARAPLLYHQGRYGTLGSPDPS